MSFSIPPFGIVRGLMQSGANYLPARIGKGTPHPYGFFSEHAFKGFWFSGFHEHFLSELVPGPESKTKIPCHRAVFSALGAGAQACSAMLNHHKLFPFTNFRAINGQRYRLAAAQIEEG